MAFSDHDQCVWHFCHTGLKIAMTHTNLCVTMAYRHFFGTNDMTKSLITHSGSSKKVRTQRQADEKHTGPEPKWDTQAALSYSKSQFDHCLGRSFYYYNYHYSTRQARPWLEHWLTQQTDLDPEQVKQFKLVPDRHIPMTVCSLILAHRQGMPMLPRIRQYVIDRVREACAQIQNSHEPVHTQIVRSESTVTETGVQERPSTDRDCELLGEWEGWLDQVIRGDVVTFDACDFLTAHVVPVRQLYKYAHWVQKHTENFMSAQAGKDVQLLESFRHYRARDYKRVFTFLADLLVGIAKYQKIKKVTKIKPCKKPLSRERLVSKLRYCKDHQALALVSVNPVDIVGAKQLWVFNVKTKKLGCYHAEEHSSLSVKGTKITGFNTVASVAKTLRKPQEQLAIWSKANKVSLRAFLKDIRAVDTPLNGSVNSDTVLLRAL